MKVGISMTPIRVVCIEDESEMIDLVSMILSREGYQVIGAPGGLQGPPGTRPIGIRPERGAVIKELTPPIMTTATTSPTIMATSM